MRTPFQLSAGEVIVVEPLLPRSVSRTEAWISPGDYLHPRLFGEAHVGASETTDTSLLDDDAVMRKA